VQLEHDAPNRARILAATVEKILDPHFAHRRLLVSGEVRKIEIGVAQLLEHPDIFSIHYPAAERLAEALAIADADAPLSVLDLAAGSGVWSIALAERSPHVNVTAVDWEGVLAVTRKVTARQGVAGRYRFVGGDLLEADFGGGHAIATLGHIIHSEGEERSRLLLKKTYHALAPGGTIAIAEILVNVARTGPLPALIFAVNMLVNSGRGDTFSLEEISGWLRDAGFEDIRTVDAPGLARLLILATKPRS
jgi:SAM-dependent methyltransferase